MHLRLSQQSKTLQLPQWYIGNVLMLDPHTSQSTGRRPEGPGEGSGTGVDAGAEADAAPDPEAGVEVGADVSEPSLTTFHGPGNAGVK